MAYVTYILWTFNHVRDLSLEDGKYLYYLFFLENCIPQLPHFGGKLQIYTLQTLQTCRRRF